MDYTDTEKLQTQANAITVNSRVMQWKPFWALHKNKTFASLTGSPSLVIKQAITASDWVMEMWEDEHWAGNAQMLTFSSTCMKRRPQKVWGYTAAPTPEPTPDPTPEPTVPTPVPTPDCFYDTDNVTLVNEADAWYYTQLESSEGIRNSCGKIRKVCGNTRRRLTCDDSVCKDEESTTGKHVIVDFPNGYSNAYQWKDLKFCVTDAAYPGGNVPYFPTPEPTVDPAVVKAQKRADTRAINTAQRVAARAPKKLENDLKAEMKANGCANFCTNGALTDHERCTYKVCQKCSECEKEMKIKHEEKLISTHYCLSYCKKDSSGAWNFKCKWNSCGGCHDCRARGASTPHGYGGGKPYKGIDTFVTGGLKGGNYPPDYHQYENRKFKPRRLQEEQVEKKVEDKPVIV